MNKVNFTLDERVRNIEKLILYLLLFISSSITLSKPGANYFGNTGIIFYLGILLISFFFTCKYLGYLVLVIGGYYGEWIAFFMEKNKKWIGVPIIIVFLFLAGMVLIFKFGYTLNQYIGAIIMGGIVIPLIANFQKISKWIENKKWV